NRLSELWSIMTFLLPGYLGPLEAFRREFALPIERYQDEDAADRLRRLVRPFVLRRLKTDPLVIQDLPEKFEHKVYCNLTREQVTLYEAVVRDALDTLRSEENGRGGVRRRGLVLAMLTRLKQVCNHPAQFLGDGSPADRRSGKLNRLVEMLEEVLAVDDRALVFTQFAQMGYILQRFLQETFGQEVLFLHGGTPQHQRDKMLERFQEDERAPSIFVLSLKAGGTGLNLMRANHVFHYDRWWNPAVENQATDRAYRIGQTRNVQVHKFICPGTLEERIDQLIESKIALAENVVGAGEAWLTELSTEELRDIVTLRSEVIEDD
ncbi:MAG: DEAD/DEAH box helicase, partial [Chloroflexi bacterium]|nr:DEAD/DEAH box helicase [Chloroflexota bacterium]